MAHVMRSSALGADGKPTLCCHFLYVTGGKNCERYFDGGTNKEIYVQEIQIGKSINCLSLELLSYVV
jgi:hypothetical protein